MIGKPVYTHTTGRIIEESHHFILTHKKCAHNGKLTELLLRTQRAAHNNINALPLTVGKNKNITQNFSRRKNANTLQDVKKCIVLISIQIWTNELPRQVGSISFRKLELILSQLTFTFLHLVIRRTKWQTSKQAFPGFPLRSYVTKRNLGTVLLNRSLLILKKTFLKISHSEGIDKTILQAVVGKNKVTEANFRSKLHNLHMNPVLKILIMELDYSILRTTLIKKIFQDIPTKQFKTIMWTSTMKALNFRFLVIVTA